MIKLEWKKLSDTAKAPAKAHAADAAYDLFADGWHVIRSGQTAIIPTGVAIKPPKGWSCDIRGRSGMNSKGKFVILGLVDADYTGPWGIVVYNGTNLDITIEHHDKIAQFTVNKIYESELEEVESFEIGANARGSKGFGSSGEK